MKLSALGAQYDAVEPENRLVARSLERVWEDRLRAAPTASSKSTASDGASEILLFSKLRTTKPSEALASDLPTLWRAPTTRPEEPEAHPAPNHPGSACSIQKRSRGEVWVKIIWQTGAVSEHRMLRRVHSYNDDYADPRLSSRPHYAARAEGLMDKQVAAVAR